MQILYDSIKTEIPKYYSDISKHFLLHLCSNGYIGYFDFLLQIINRHQMMSESDLVSLIKEGFLEGCTYGRFELVRTLYANCTSSTTGLETNPKYGVKVFFGEDLQRGFDLCLAKSKEYVDILAQPHTHHLEIIKWLHQLSRQPGHNPINITYDIIYDSANDHQMRYPEDVTACLEMLISGNVIE